MSHSVVSQEFDELRTDEAAAADDDDFHGSLRLLRLKA
jgi:hypothetical protein